ncbi:hypothetical protein F0M18_07485 [Pseudohalioglobus sediminis]|uniref:Uncharacterized protein n=1 Tax=Pseudohalioglobus sediminis TaxID=2606449 RepID=A0A5B0X1F7_9GAMM|nr:hypothetical protein [Pseudohalioglobus sediminis]KAA1192505.1 hypothetical protein F0M18_07485 [Pseudohalioglobus sediminis]
MSMLSTLQRTAVLTGKSCAFIARNGPKPTGSLRVCRAEIALPTDSYPLYEALVQMETARLEMPQQPRLVLNFIEVADHGYREFQVMMRAAYGGQERWYLNHILINNFFGWIYGLKDYGYNKYLYQLDYRFDDQNASMDMLLPAGKPYMRAAFRADPAAPVLEVDDDGSYSVKDNKLIYCKTAMSSIKDVSLHHGYIDVQSNHFVQHQAEIDYPVEWSRLIPEGRHAASLYHGDVKEIGMEPLQVLETW